MPRPKGFAPYSDFWILQWSIVPKTSKLNRPRIGIFPTQGAAQTVAANLNNAVGPNPGQIASGTVQTPYHIKFFNSKPFVQQIIKTFADICSVSD